MRPLVETHPRAAPWAAGAVMMAPMTLVSWLTDSAPSRRAADQGPWETAGGSDADDSLPRSTEGVTSNILRCTCCAIAAVPQLRAAR